MTIVTQNIIYFYKCSIGKAQYVMCRVCWGVKFKGNQLVEDGCF